MSVFASVCVGNGEGELKKNLTIKGQGGIDRHREMERAHTQTNKRYMRDSCALIYSTVNAINEGSRGAQVTKQSRREQVH